MITQSTLSSRLHTQLGEMISKLGPGERLPTEPRLAQMMGVSRATLREAMRTFETQGRIQRRQGVGTFVVHPSSVMDTGLELLESIESMAGRAGLVVKMGAFETETRDANEEETKLFGRGQVSEVRRVIEAEDRPIAYLSDVLPQRVLAEQELRTEFTGSVLDLLLKRTKSSVSSSDTEIHATAAEPRVAKALRIQRGDVILHFKSTLFSLDGEAIDLSRSFFLPGYFRFHVIRRVEPRLTEFTHSKP